MSAPESKTSKRIARGREREEEALKWRLSGLTYRLISEEMGISESGAYKAVIRALRRLNEHIAEKAEEVRRMELERLDKMLRGLWPRALTGNQGAVDRVLRIMQRRALLLGLDAPKAVDVTTGGEPLKVIYVDDWRDKAPQAAPGPADSNARSGEVQVAGGGAAVAQDDVGDEHSS